MKRLVVVVNPAAGNGQALKKWHQVEKQLAKPYEVFFSEYHRHAVEFAQQISQDAQPTLLVAIGGDGTVHEVIEGCSGSTHVEVVALSAGSGNDFGRTFTTVKSAEEIDLLMQSTTSVQMRIGQLSTPLNRAIFVNNAGYGFDAKVVYAANRSIWKKRFNRYGLGKVAYYGVVVKELLTYRPSSLHLEIDGRPHQIPDVWFVVVCNQSYFGGGMKISPQSNPVDDILEATVVSNISRWKLLVLFGTVFIGWHTKLKAVQSFSGTSFRFRFAHATIGHTDGEFCGELLPHEWAEVSLKPQTWAMPVK